MSAPCGCGQKVPWQQPGRGGAAGLASGYVPVPQQSSDLLPVLLAGGGAVALLLLLAARKSR